MDECVDPDEWMIISKHVCGSTDFVEKCVCMCESTRRVFEYDIVFGMYIILYIRTNH